MPDDDRSPFEQIDPQFLLDELSGQHQARRPRPPEPPLPPNDLARALAAYITLLLWAAWFTRQASE